MTPSDQSDQHIDVNAALRTAIEITTKDLLKNRLPPVKRKIIKVIHERLLILQSDLASKPTERTDKNQEINSRIIGITNLLRTKNENAIWDVADSLKELLIEIGPLDFVYRSLVEEKGRKPGDDHQWSQYFGRQELEKVIKDYEKNREGFNRGLAVQRLLTLYRLRDNDGRHHRAREELRWQYLFWVSISLLATTLLSVLLATRYGTIIALPEMLIIGTAGAAGALVSGTLSLRNLESIVELKGARKTLIPQVFLGASLAFIVVIVLKTDLIKIGGFDFQSINTTGLYVISLLSGFSEPFALGILDRIANLWKAN